MWKPISRKIFLNMTSPKQGDIIGDRERIVAALLPEFGPVLYSLEILKMDYRIIRESDWNLTVTIVNTGKEWEVVRVEQGDTTKEHYGLAVDLGSTTVVMQLVDMNTGTIMAEESEFNQQIAYGEDILSRIFYVKDQPDRLIELQKITTDNFIVLMEKIQKKTGKSCDKVSILTIGGNTTMIHFLFGFDPWYIFHAPFSPSFNRCGFVLSDTLGLPVRGLVYCFPSVANYLGGDIVGGVISTGMLMKNEIALYMDIGTNGEMILGNDEFLLAAAGAAGPALEGGISNRGMRANPGAVDTVKIKDDKLMITTIADEYPIGICGSGIVDLLAEMLLEGWMDFSGVLIPGKSDRIIQTQEEYAVVYAWETDAGRNEDLMFTQTDIFRFMETKAAANTMVYYLIEALGIEPSQIERIYMAGAFGTHLNLESAITIGIYPDLPRDRYVHVGNGSLKGAYDILGNIELLNKAEEIINHIDYISLGEATDFLTKMYAAKFFPHTNLDSYPSVKEKLQKRRKVII